MYLPDDFASVESRQRKTIPAADFRFVNIVSRAKNTNFEYCRISPRHYMYWQLFLVVEW